MEIYAKLRDDVVDSTECLHAPVSVDKDGAGGLVGVEVLGAVEVTVDGVVVAPATLKTWGLAEVERIKAMMEQDPAEAALLAQRLWDEVIDVAEVLAPVRTDTVRTLKRRTGWSYGLIAEHIKVAVTTVAALHQNRKMTTRATNKNSVPLRTNSGRGRKRTATPA
jgi:hypothetical protein